jgi:hypothetical protein
VTVAVATGTAEGTWALLRAPPTIPAVTATAATATATATFVTVVAALARMGSG